MNIWPDYFHLLDNVEFELRCNCYTLYILLKYTKKMCAKHISKEQNRFTVKSSRSSINMDNNEEATHFSVCVAHHSNRVRHCRSTLIYLLYILIFSSKTFFHYKSSLATSRHRSSSVWFRFYQFVGVYKKDKRPNRWCRF